MEGLVFGGAYVWREICISKLARLTYIYIYSWKEFYGSNLQKGFTETRLEDADLCKTQPCQYFVYMDQGNPSRDLKYLKLCPDLSVQQCLVTLSMSNVRFPVFDYAVSISFRTKTSSRKNTILCKKETHIR